VTVNPVIHAASTLKNKDVQFDKEAVVQHYDQMAAYLGVDEPDRENLNFKRVGHANGFHVSQPNVILVFLESFATYKTGLSGNALDPTPYFDSLARDGIYFDNFFVPHTGTARSVFTALTGLADVETQRTSSRNPLIVNQHTIVNAFKDYEKLYFIGGSASWGNIRGLLSHNIPGLKLYEEGSYESPRMDVWGISDLHLFEEANKVLRTQQKPFFAIIQTSGNHRPYNIPEDNRGFQVRDVDKKEVFEHGFHSVGEYNSFRFMDHSIRIFIEEAKKESYFDNTVFVFFGDHGIHANTGKHTPKFEEQLKIQGLRVPFVIYAPRLLPKGKVINKVASEVDVLPTIAGLAANGYVNTTMGRDLLDERFDNMRYAFTVTHGQGLRIGLLDDRYYFLMNDDGSNKVLHDMHSDNPRDNVMAQFSDEAHQLEQFTRAIFETTRYMRYHNSRM
jgi:phosphoglycerol transferase MdoB-like AlkP superfamily enzyme